ncbi:hypothetical protein N7501_011844 [Penicillium viridicatum]|nr:hypothetical protein N7501_011844 [Penicillium viridicatum]
MATNIQLKDPSLLIGQNYIDGKWLKAEYGKRFNVTDAASLSKPQSDLTPMQNGKGKPDATGEVLFAASFLKWFAEEAARIYGDVIPHTRIFNFGKKSTEGLVRNTPMQNTDISCIFIPFGTSSSKVTS